MEDHHKAVVGLQVLIAALLLVLVVMVAMLVARIPADLNDDLDKGPLNVCVQNQDASPCQSAPRADNQ